MATAPSKLKSRPKLWHHAKVATAAHVKRITGNRHVTITKQVMDAEPLCRPCSELGFVTPAEQVDHIVPLWKGGQEHPDNRQPICLRCHKAKTRKEASERAAMLRRGR